MQVRSRGGKDPLEKEMATHSSILAWKIPCSEQPGGLYSVHGVTKHQTWLSMQVLMLIVISTYKTSSFDFTRETTSFYKYYPGPFFSCQLNQPVSWGRLAQTVKLVTAYHSFLDPCFQLEPQNGELIRSTRDRSMAASASISTTLTKWTLLRSSQYFPSLSWAISGHLQLVPVHFC